MKVNKIFISSLLLLSASMLFFACTPDDPNDPQGELVVSVTDAPIDDASVRGVFVTVAEIQIDGKSYAGFEGKQTVDLLALQNGKTQLLGAADLETGTYADISLVLDLETDANGNSPGCYVWTDSGEKIDLAADGSSTLEVSTRQSLEVEKSATSELVIDVDLRKAVQSSSSGSYSFVSQSELDASIRAIRPEKSGQVEGEFSTGLFADYDKVVVYVYEKGSFNQETESQTSNGIAFKNAVSSSLAVKNGGSYEYTLSFLEEGEYEVCMAAYEDQDSNGAYEFKGFLNAATFLNGSVSSTVSVEAGLATSLSLSIIGIIN